MSVTWVFLALAIVAEIAATSLLPRTKGFRRPVPTVAVTVLYIVAFYFLAQTLRTLDLGITYALWSGAGTAAIAAIGILFLRESRSALKITGILLVIAGVVILNLGGAL